MSEKDTESAIYTSVWDICSVGRDGKLKNLYEAVKSFRSGVNCWVGSKRQTNIFSNLGLRVHQHPCFVYTMLLENALSTKMTCAGPYVENSKIRS